MQVSAEIRWFWPSMPPSGLEEWFMSVDAHGCTPGGGGIREDVYLRDPNQQELGIKLRGASGSIDVKGLVAVRSGALPRGPFDGPVEIWAKWTSHALRLVPHATIGTKKTRWMRKFDTSGSGQREIALGPDERPSSEVVLPERGCNVELTRIEIAGDVWFSFGFESFGGLETVESDLQAVAATLTGRTPPALGRPQSGGYPTWLVTYAGRLPLSSTPEGPSALNTHSPGPHRIRFDTSECW
jgi:hypothetical protein